MLTVTNKNQLQLKEKAMGNDHVTFSVCCDSKQKLYLGKFRFKIFFFSPTVFLTSKKQIFKKKKKVTFQHNYISEKLIFTFYLLEYYLLMLNLKTQIFGHLVLIRSTSKTNLGRKLLKFISPCFVRDVISNKTMVSIYDWLIHF